MKTASALPLTEAEYRLEPISASTVLVHKRESEIPYTVGLDVLRKPFVCTCRGWYWRRTCKHVEMVADALQHGDITVLGLLPDDTDPEEDAL